MHSGDRWATFPDIPTESAVWGWWSRLQDVHLTNLRGMFYRTTSKKDMRGLDSEGQLDLFVKSRQTLSPDLHEWANVRVIGEHTVSTKSGEKFLQLAKDMLVTSSQLSLDASLYTGSSYSTPN